MLVDGVPYKINTDFRAGISFSLLASAGRLTKEDARTLMFPESCPGELDTALDAAELFLSCGDIGSSASGKIAPPYSLAADSDAIISAFRRNYDIDLLSAKMHWWTFRALLNDLVSADLRRRIDYRTRNMDGVKDAKLKAHYAQMRQHYALQPSGQRQLVPQTLEEYNAWLLSGGRSLDATV